MRELARQLLSRTEELLGERGRLLRGAFQLRGTRCGKENCKCNEGELHTTAVLVVSENGKRRSYYLRGPERPEVKRRVERYRRFRAGRIELKKLTTELLDACGDLLDALAEPHAPQRDSAGGDRRGRTRRRRRQS
jgi:hypothetical protein